MIQATNPDLVLLDWDLPGQPLAEVLAQVQSADCTPKIIALSKDGEDREVAVAAGADAFVIKGDPPRQLLAALRQISSQS